jgi:hypothetical protein
MIDENEERTRVNQPINRPASHRIPDTPWMGATHFLTRKLPRVRTEMSLHVLAYNLKRAMNILGTRALLQAIAA